MIKFEIIQKVKIEPISEEILAELVKKEILAQIPEAHVNSVNFERKLNPSRIEAIIDAQYGAPKEQSETLTIKREASVPESKDSLIESVLETPEPEATSSGDVADMFKV